jgi:hypothetical protein
MHNNVMEVLIMEDIKTINKENCEAQTIEAWAAWYEGEEGWGIDDD